MTAHRAPVSRATRAHRRDRLVAAALVVSVGSVLIGGSSALAYWQAPGTGSGSAAAGTTLALTTTTAAVAGTKLYPGGPAGDLRLTVSNPNGFPAVVSAVAPNGPVTASGGTGTCATTGVALATPSAGLPFTVPASGSVTVTLTGAVTMSTAAEAGCQNATFTVPVTLSGRTQ